MALLLTVAATDVRAERGHLLYGDMVNRQKVRELQAQIAAGYSCKRRDTPLLVIERPETRLVMFRGGAVQLTVADGTLEACVDRNVNDWVRWKLANVSWKAGAAPAGCTAQSQATTRFVIDGRERFVERECGPTLGAKHRERLVETEAVLLAAVRKANAR